MNRQKSIYYNSCIINKEIERQANRLGAKLTDPRECPYWDAGDNLYYGVLASDRAHYVPKIQEWFADEFLGDIL